MGYRTSAKIRRHSGYVTPEIHQVTMKFSDMIEQALEPQPFYDDWKDFRDGMRDWAYLAWKKRDLEKKSKRKIYKSN